MNLTAEILAVGTEILLGNIANTDAQDVSAALSELGINIYYHTVVGDNPTRVKEAVDIARKRADIIITTGGLGPTYDDLTKQTLAEAFGKELYYDEASAARIKELFREKLHGAQMTENNLLQAYLPVGCTVFENSCGTAPGCAFEADGKYVLMLPGPPSECRAMLKTGAVPYLKKLSGMEIRSHNIHIFGMARAVSRTDFMI
jgi:nicotinamide-nucleotide amidase